MFENITAAPADPILGLADLFRADDRPTKINLGIGVYKDETGKTPVLTSVKKAEQYLLENETTKNYLGIDGIPEFGRCTQELLFGKGNHIISDKRARTAQTPGGTGALRVAADFLAKNTDVKRVWVSNPSWPNHKGVFNSAGLEVREYAYYDAANHSLDFDGLLNSLQEAQAGDVVLFHGCCHNPTASTRRWISGNSSRNCLSRKAGCRCSISPTRALLAVWKKMLKACARLPRCIKSLSSRARSPKTLACTTSA